MHHFFLRAYYSDIVSGNENLQATGHFIKSSILIFLVEYHCASSTLASPWLCTNPFARNHPRFVLVMCFTFAAREGRGRRCSARSPSPPPRMVRSHARAPSTPQSRTMHQSRQSRAPGTLPAKGRVRQQSRRSHTTKLQAFHADLYLAILLELYAVLYLAILQKLHPELCLAVLHHLPAKLT